jgi:hypothetical protein
VAPESRNAPKPQKNQLVRPVRGVKRDNREPGSPVKRINKFGGFMSFFSKLLGKSEPPKQRVQVCVECGMPVADHKQWCSILQGQNELKLKSEKKTA